MSIIVQRVQQARFYIRRVYFCPRCQANLMWRRRPGVPNSMMLVHPSPLLPDANTCVSAGKNFYPPCETLAEIPEDLVNV